MGNILIRSLKVFGAGCCVYFAMAACSSDGGSTSSGASSSGSSGSSSSGSAGAMSSSGQSSGSSGQSSGSPVPNAMADDWYASGSRLKIQYYEATDGAKTFVGLFDSMRGETCFFGVHADGTTRCMPTATPASLFGDAGCSVPAVIVTKGQAAPKYLNTVFTPGRRYTASPSATLYTGSPAACTDLTTGYSPLYDFYSEGTEVPASAFVDATLKTAP